MCGRYTLRTPAAELAEYFGVEPEFEFAPRFNVAPTQMVAAVRAAEIGRRFCLLKWGLIPSWADDPKVGNRMLNARADTVASKPAYRTALRRRRCLVAADGFYEWQPVPGSKRKQPFHFRLIGGGPFAFAGLWEHWEKPGHEPIDSCTIVTTEANTLVGAVHDRMPVILQRGDHELWLDPRVTDADAVLPLLRPLPAELMEAKPVGTRVNSPAFDDPDCLRSPDGG